MGRLFWWGIFLGFYGFSSSASVPPAALELGYQLESTEYASLLGDEVDPTDPLQAVIKTGTRLMHWLKQINEGKPQKEQISLSSASSGVPLSIDAPGRYSPSLILHRFQLAQKKMPPWMADVINGEGPLPRDLPGPVETFRELALQLDGAYQLAARWLLLSPWLDRMAGKKRGDLRGFYFLSRDPDLQKKWAQWSSVKQEERARILEWLNGMCLNANEDTCSSVLPNAAEDGEKLSRLYSYFYPYSERRWNYAFDIRNPRTDVKWEGDRLTVPFAKPGSLDLLNFLRVNIEDEWRWKDWALKLDFIPGGKDSIQLEFEPGATPRVDRDGGNRILMDKNAPLTEYDVTWAIRHEFGHVLGFPDCYVEFYDESSQTMITYPLDVDDIMCTANGHFKQRHYDALKAAYFR